MSDAVPEFPTPHRIGQRATHLGLAARRPPWGRQSGVDSALWRRRKKAHFTHSHCPHGLLERGLPPSTCMISVILMPEAPSRRVLPSQFSQFSLESGGGGVGGPITCARMSPGVQESRASDLLRQVLPPDSGKWTCRTALPLLVGPPRAGPVGLAAKAGLFALVPGRPSMLGCRRQWEAGGGLG